MSMRWKQDTNLKETVIENEKNDTPSNKRVVYFRWLFIAFILPAFFHISGHIVSSFMFFETLAIIMIYNFFATYVFLKRNSNHQNIAWFVSYMDVLAICVFSYQLGGTDSEIYVLLFFIIGLCGVLGDIPKVMGIGIFSAVAYVLSTAYAAKNHGEGLEIWTLSLRVFFLLMTAYGISFIIAETKRYDAMHKREFKLARTDKLTGLANRHYLDQKLQEEVEYADLSGEPLNILIFDIDNFKKFNDTYGHMWGDKLLTLFSDIIKQNVRKSDIPVRYGGEEFLMLIRGLSMDMAKSIADRIRRQLEKEKIHIGHENDRKMVTVSCGVAQYPKHSKNVKEVMDFADKALYHAKEMGKNVVIGFDEIENVQNTEQIDIEMFMGK